MIERHNERESALDHAPAITHRMPLVDAPPAASCAISVVIPARNEAGSVLTSLAALAEQRGLDGRPFPRATYEVILLANNCQDQTAQVARSLAARAPDFALHVVEVALPPALAHVGFARRLAMDEAHRRFAAIRHPWGVIATTDADTVVAPTWLAATLREVERGADVVSGRILMNDYERQAMTPAVRRRYLYDVGYQALVNEVTAHIDPQPHDPWPHHHQFLGASMALTASAYRRVGGLPVVRSSEDVALARALCHADIGIRHSPDVRVSTSGRLHGRAPGGMAATLAAWSALGTQADHYDVPAASAMVARATGGRSLRDQWQRIQAGVTTCPNELARLAEATGVATPRLREALQEHQRFGTLLEAVECVATWPGSDAMSDVRVAIAELRAWLAARRRCSVPAQHQRQHREPLVLPERPAIGSLRGTGYALPLSALADAEPEAVQPFAPPHKWRSQPRVASPRTAGAPSFLPAEQPCPMPARPGLP